MTELGNSLFEYYDKSPAEFAPDGKKFVIVVRRGDVVHNTVRYSLLLFSLPEDGQSAKPETLVTIASSSNRPGIDDVHWMKDSQTLVFLGSHPNEPSQVYEINVNTRTPRKLLAHGTDIVGFDATADRETMVFEARAPVEDFYIGQAGRSGFVVEDQMLADLIVGHVSYDDPGVLRPFQVFVHRYGSKAKLVSLGKDKPQPQFGLAVSPNGRFVVAATALWNDDAEVPHSYLEYSDPRLRTRNFLFRYVLIDIDKGTVRPLIDAPTMGLQKDIVWSSGNSVVVSGTYLSLDGADLSEKELRKSNMFTVEIDVTTGEIRKIVRGAWHIVNWDVRTGDLYLKDRGAFQDSPKNVVVYRKSGKEWRKVDIGPQVANGRFQISEQQDMNTPPVLTLRDAVTKQTTVLMDLNPQLHKLHLGKVEEIEWKTSDGRKAKGGLYLPPCYIAGQRYPLVIQTHGWDAAKFRMDGAYTAGYAAQALAARGFIVAQTSDWGLDDPSYKDYVTTREGPGQMAVFEGLVDDLDARGLIDRKHVGLFGYSRTGYHVRYTLAFSKFHFAAAVLVDGLDDGYFQYMSWLNLRERGVGIYESLNGGAPFGDGLKSWLKNAPSFNLPNVHTPVRLLAFSPRSLLDKWEWFAGLRYLGKPVELLYFPYADHEPVLPSERMTAQEGDVDWFCFWLMGKEDFTDQSKASEYVRWRALRKESSERTSATQ